MKIGDVEIGWKTVAGSLLLAGGYVCDVLGVDPAIGDAWKACGAALGGVGLRMAIARLGK